MQFIRFLFLGPVVGLLTVSAEDARGVAVVPKAPTGESVIGEHWLFLIAVNRYQAWPNLRGPVNDVNAFKKVLLENYFYEARNVVSLVNEKATKSDIIREFNCLVKKLRPEDSLLLYFSGHGDLTDAGVGYWIPYDGGLDSDVQDRWIPAATVHGYLTKLKCRHALVIADSCFSGNLVIAARNRPEEITNEFYRQAWERSSREILTSGSEEQVPDTEIDDHSAFAFHLIRELESNREPYLDPLKIFANVRTGMKRSVPLMGTLKDGGHQEGGSYLFFRREQAVEIADDKMGGAASGSGTPGVQTPPSGTTPARPTPQAPKETEGTSTVVRLSGEIFLETEPEGAAIYVDDEVKPRGETPKKVTIDLSAARTQDATITLKLKGHKRKQLTVEVERGAQVELETIALEKYGEFEIYTRWPFDAEEAKRRQKETAEALGAPIEFDEDLGGGVTMRFVLIPAGEFMMGSPQGESGRDADEGPVHKVRFTKPFYIGKYEVTQAQWVAVMGNNPSYHKGDSKPVEQVSWNDCQDFARRMNKRMKKTKGQEFALLTEAQWEYACRGGSDQRFCFGDSDGTLGEYAWYSSNSNNETHPVGLKKPNAWGVHDMHGNVWEWCRDLYCPYETGEASDPGGAGDGASRVLRGGDYCDDTWVCRSAGRPWDGPAFRLRFGSIRLGVVLVELR